MLPHYKPSGRTSPRLLPFALIAIAVAIGLAWPYQALINWVPLIYINLVVYVVFGGLLLAITRMACASGHNRNRILGALIGIAVATGGIGASHYFSYRSTYNDVVDEMKKDPDFGGVNAEELVAKTLTFGKFIDLKVKTGWTLGHRSASNATSGDIVGPLVWLVWGIEALGLLGAAVYGGIRGTPFCETCNKSLDEQDLFTRTDLDLGDLTGLTEARSAAALVDVPPRAETSVVGLRVKYVVHACPTCDGDAYLTVSSVLPNRSHGERDEQKTLHSEVVLERPHYDRLLALRDELAQAGSTRVR